MELAKAYVQIIPSASGIQDNIEKAISGDVSGAGISAGKVFGAGLVKAISGVVAAAGIGNIIRKSLDMGGALQQSYGGLETIYGEAAEAAKKYAAEAAKAGISANDYAEQAVSFGASLKQAFSGDTTKAVEAANIAIMDMTDNAAKMGTPIENIQNAYQGFAKQNYTMLDNLKLGYGGTKTEMERLLADATKLSGVKYDISNLGDVYSAIHVIQQNLGLTGVAAQEASETFSGSMGAMKAAAENFMANLALGEDITEPLRIMVGNAVVFVQNNLLPMIKNVFMAVPTLLRESLSMITESHWVDAAVNIMNGLKNSIDNFSGQILGVDSTIVESIKNGIINGIPRLVDGVVNLIKSFTGFMASHAGEVVETGIGVIKSVVQGIINAMPTLIQNVPIIIQNITRVINENMPKILKAGLDIIVMIGKGIIQNIPVVIANMGNIVKAIIGVVEAINWINLGANLIKLFATGIKNLIPMALEFFKAMISGFVEGITGGANWLDLGANIIRGIANGITGAAHAVIEAARNVASNIFDSVAGFFRIGSPSRLMADKIGAMIPAGIAEGIEDNIRPLQSAMEEMAIDTVGSYDLNVAATPGMSTQSLQNSVNYGGVTINVTAANVQQSGDFVSWLEEQLASRETRRMVAALV